MDAERRIAVIRNRLEQVDRERARLESRRAQEPSGMTDYLIDLQAADQGAGGAAAGVTRRRRICVHLRAAKAGSTPAAGTHCWRFKLAETGSDPGLCRLATAH